MVLRSLVICRPSQQYEITSINCTLFAFKIVAFCIHVVAFVVKTTETSLNVVRGIDRVPKFF